jgi:hypothetical protein
MLAQVVATLSSHANLNWPCNMEPPHEWRMRSGSTALPEPPCRRQQAATAAMQNASFKDKAVSRCHQAWSCGLPAGEGGGGGGGGCQTSVAAPAINSGTTIKQWGGEAGGCACASCALFHNTPSLASYRTAGGS